jgi:hypothetical protein
MRPQAVPVDDVAEVLAQFGLFGEEVVPVIAGLEAVAVEVIGDVDSGTRIAVLPPGSAGSGVLLHDGERNARLLEPDAGQHTRLAAADDDDVEALGTGEGPGPAGIGTLQVEFLENQWHVVLVDGFAGRPVEHLAHQVVG